MIDLNWDLLAAGAVATTLHVAGFVVLSGVAPPETRPSELAAAEVMEVLLVAPPSDRREAAPLAETLDPARPGDGVERVDVAEAAEPAEWTRRARPPLPAPAGGAMVTVQTPLRAASAPLARSETLIEAETIDAGAGPPAPDRREVRPVDPPAAAPPAVEIPAEAAPSPPPARPAAPVVPPVVVRNDPPRYPSSARRRGHEGTVDLHVHVLVGGDVGAVEILRSSGHESLDRAAARAAARWRFTPATRGGRAVDMWIEIPVQFDIDDERARP